MAFPSWVSGNSVTVWVFFLFFFQQEKADWLSRTTRVRMSWNSGVIKWRVARSFHRRVFSLRCSCSMPLALPRDTLFDGHADDRAPRLSIVMHNWYVLLVFSYLLLLQGVTKSHVQADATLASKRDNSLSYNTTLSEWYKDDTTVGCKWVRRRCEKRPCCWGTL